MGSHTQFSDAFCDWATQETLDVCERAYDEARFSAVDTVSCMVLGATDHQPNVAMEAMSFGNGEGNVQPIGGGKKVSLIGAALINGARAHSIDFDDYELSGSSHASAPLFSALLSLARVQEMTIKELCEAWIVGYEAIIWMGEAIGYGHYDKGWHSTSTLGPVGVAAAAARALGLDKVAMANAMSIATSSAAGLKLQFGFDTKAIHAGLAASAGLQAALLAKAGASANHDVWQKERGYVDVYGTEDSLGFAAVADSMTLGRAVDKYPVARKLWPSCAYTHRPIFAAENLSKKISPEQKIESIEYRMPEPFYRVAGYTVPTNDAEARFSVGYCVVTGLLTGHVEPEDFLHERFSDAVRQEMTANVRLDLYELPKGDSGDIGPSNPEQLIVTLQNGERLVEEVLNVPGGEAMQMTHQQLMQKVSDCKCSEKISENFLNVDLLSSVTESKLLDQTI